MVFCLTYLVFCLVYLGFWLPYLVYGGLFGEHHIFFGIIGVYDIFFFKFVLLFSEKTFLTAINFAFSVEKRYAGLKKVVVVTIIRRGKMDPEADACLLKPLPTCTLSRQCLAFKTMPCRLADYDDYDGNFDFLYLTQL